MNKWQIPSIDILPNPNSSSTNIEGDFYAKNNQIIEKKFSQFDIQGHITEFKSGPAVTLFEYKPNDDIRIAKIAKMTDDLCLALANENIRIVAPIPNKDVIGIEIPNPTRQMVNFKDCYQQSDKLLLPLGKQADGTPYSEDLKKLPHLIIAGTTGSGKSVFLHAFINNLLLSHSPETLKLLLIDPKQVELAPYRSLPHLAQPIVTDTSEAIKALEWAISEMERRYKLMVDLGVNNITNYNNKSETKLPNLVLIIEEFGDLMSVKKNEVEQLVVRLAQKSRASGIHLVITLQRPSHEVMTGLIKANIPARICFKVASKLESRIVLDESGAEKLLSSGDMLFLNPTVSKPIRLHAPFINNDEINKITLYWNIQNATKSLYKEIETVNYLNKHQNQFETNKYSHIISSPLGNYDVIEINANKHSNKRYVIKETPSIFWRSFWGTVMIMGLFMTYLYFS